MSFAEVASIASLELAEIGFSKDDVLIAFSSSARNPYTYSALGYAKDLKARSIFITNNVDHEFGDKTTFEVVLPIDNYSINGLRSFEATTLLKILIDSSIISTMEKIGYIYKGELVYLKYNTDKSKLDALDILTRLTNGTKSNDELIRCVNNKYNIMAVAVIMAIKNLDEESAKELLDLNNGNVKTSLEN
ncbi:MAG: hypothetical protein ACK5KR_04260 [Breznakia sp.]